MQLKHLVQASPHAGGVCRVTAVAWSPNGKRLAVVTTERLVLLFDEEGTKKDKFTTKPIDKVLYALCISATFCPCFLHDHLIFSITHPFSSFSGPEELYRHVFSLLTDLG
jgi:hypothetical protein